MSVGLGNFRFSRPVVVVVVRNKPLKSANTDGVAFDTANALAFALALLGANPTADCRQGAGKGNYLVGTFKVTLFNLVDKVGNVNVYGATLNAGCIFAVQASLRLVNCNFGGIAQRYLFKIPCSNQGFLGRHRVLF